MLFKSFINKIIPARRWREWAAEEDVMSDNRNLVPVRVIVSVVGYGRNTEIINRSYTVPEEFMDPDTFIANCPEQYIAHRGRAYRYLDCVAECFLSGGELITVFHIRYILDVEKEKFKSFLRSARPAHCPVKKAV